MKFGNIWAWEGEVPCFESPNLRVDNWQNSNLQPHILSMKLCQMSKLLINLDSNMFKWPKAVKILSITLDYALRIFNATCMCKSLFLQYQTVLITLTQNMEPQLLWPKNCWILNFLTDPIPVVSKWLGKIKDFIVGLYTGSDDWYH